MGRSAFARPGIYMQLWIMMQLVDVLMYAHSMGWVHADVKAANIMLTADGRVILVDWGLSYMISEPDKMWRCAASPTLFLPRSVPLQWPMTPHCSRASCCMPASQAVQSSGCSTCECRWLFAVLKLPILDTECHC